MAEALLNRSKKLVAMNLHEVFLSLIMGLIIGVLTVTIMISFGSLIFSGQLSGYVNQGVGFALFGAVVFSSALALVSSFKGLVAVPQDTTVSVLAVMAVAVSGSVGSQDTAAITVVFLIVFTTLLTGAVLFLIGFFKMGNLIRFIPYPVIGGFLTGSGLLLVRGSVGVMTGVNFSLSQISVFWQTDIMGMWLPGVLFAFLILLLMRKYNNFFVLPAMLLGGVALFYLTAFLLRVPVSEIMEKGWLLGPFARGGFWNPIPYQQLSQMDWALIRGQMGNVIAVPVLSLISLLLNVSGIELATEQESDINHELRAVGLLNLVAGMGGSMSGYHALSLSVLGHKIGIKSRLIGVFTATTCVVTLFLGANIVSLFPKPVLGGLVMFLGLAFLVEWLFDARSKLPKADYFIVLLMLVVIGAFGFLPGVAVGLVVTIISFAVQYSRITVIKHCLSGAEYQSSVDRCLEEQFLLQEKGHQIQILKLQGYLFFGTADNLLHRIRELLSRRDPKVQYILLDFRQVTGIDSSAINSFQKARRLTEGQQVQFILTNVPVKVGEQLEKGGLSYRESSYFHIYADLDYAVEWCEEEILQAGATNYKEAKLSIQKKLLTVIQDQSIVSRLLTYLEKKELAENHQLITQGNPNREICFIDSGKVTAQLKLDNGRIIRLRTICAGVVGEVGTYLGIPASASIITEGPCRVYYISEASLREMEREDPQAAAAFHKFIAYILAERLICTNNSLRALI